MFKRFFSRNTDSNQQKNENHTKEERESNALEQISEGRNQTFEKIIQPVFQVAHILKNFKFLVEDKEFESIEDVRQLYQGLTNKKFSTIQSGGDSIRLLRELEYIISKKVENCIKLRISKATIKDFDIVFDGLISQRTRNFKDDLQKIIQMKNAIYNQVSILIKLFQNKKEEERIREITLILNMSQGELEFSDQEFVEDERQFLSSVLKINNIDNKNQLEIHEEIIIRLSKNHINLMKLNMEYSNCKVSDDKSQVTKQKLEEKSKKLQSKLEAIRKINSKNLVIISIQKFVSRFYERVENEKKAKDLIKYLKKGRELDFVNQLIKLKKEIKQQKQCDAYNIGVKETLLDIIKIALGEEFKDDQVEMKNEILLSIMDHYDNERKPIEQQESCVYDLIDLLEIEESLSKGNYIGFMSYFNIIMGISGIKEDFKIDLEKQIKIKFEEELAGVRKDINSVRVRVREGGQRFYLALNILETKLDKLIEQKITKESFSALYGILECIKNYIKDKDTLLQTKLITQLKKDSNANKIKIADDEGVQNEELSDEDKERIVNNNFLKKVISILEECIKDQINRDNRITISNILYDFIDCVQTFNSANQDLNNEYLLYLDFRIKLGKIDGVIELINREIIENKIINLVQKLGNARQTKMQESLFSFVQQANLLINEWYKNDLIQSIYLIQNSLIKKNKEYAEIKNSIIDAYKRKQKRESKLIMRGQVKFLNQLIEKKQSNNFDPQSSTLQELGKEFRFIKEQQTQKDIEDYYICKINSFGLLKLTEKLQENNVSEETVKYLTSHLNDIKKNRQMQVSNIYKKIFVEDNSIASKAMRTLGEMAKKQENNKMVQSNQEQEDIIKQVMEYFKIIEIVMELILFDSKEEQEKINNVQEELMVQASKLFGDNLTSSELSKKLENICKILVSAGYRKNMFLDYADGLEFKEYTINFNQKIYTLSIYVRNRFSNIDFNRKLNPHGVIELDGKRNIVIRFQGEFNNLKDQIPYYSSQQINEKIDDIISRFNDEKEIKQQEETIMRSEDNETKYKLFKTVKKFQRSTHLELDIVENRVQELISYKNLDIISQDLLQQLQIVFTTSYRDRFLSEINKNIKCLEDNNTAEHIKRIQFVIEQITDKNLKLQTYSFYYKLCKDIKSIDVQQLDEMGNNLLLELYRCEKESPLKIIQSKIERQDYKNLVEIIQFLPVFSSNSETKQQINQILEILIEKIYTSQVQSEGYEQILQALLQYSSQICKYKSIDILVNRILDIINFLVNLLSKQYEVTGQCVEKTQKQSELKEDLVKIFKLFLSLSEDQSQEDIIGKIFEQNEDQSKWIQYLLKEGEIRYAKFLDNRLIIQNIKQQPVQVWQDIFENLYIEIVSIEILQNEVKEIQSNPIIQGLNKEIEKFVESTYFDDSKTAVKQVIDQEKLKLTDEDMQLQLNKKLNILEQISTFKNHLFASKELIINKTEWVLLLEIIRKKKKSDSIQLKVIIEVLKYSKLFEDISQLIRIIDESKNQKQIMLGVLAKVLSKIPSKDCKDESRETYNKILEEINNFTDKNEFDYISLLISEIAKELEARVEYEQSEMALLKDIIHLSLLVEVPSNKKIFDLIITTRVLKWDRILRQEKIKIVLDRKDKKLIDDILFIEKIKGVKLTNGLINIIKEQNLSDFEVKYIVEKFKKNIWELSIELLNKIREGNNEFSIKTIEKYDNELKKKELNAAQLVSYMKRLEGVGEINHSIKHLIDQSEKGLSLIEQCLQKIDPNNVDSIYNNKATVVQVGNDNSHQLNTNISEYSPDDILLWARIYRKLKKDDKEGRGIAGNGILELMAVISRAVILTNKFDLRNTQKIAIFLFIDSMINSFSGRLADISTGEGKSLITIVTAIVRILISGGGTVDILTSSEVLAERDAKESEIIFGLFDLKVSNNCDQFANNDEKLRKERYECNDIIYGEIGHFQRDILLTKYYGKEIRSQLGTCLIIDEVDSMCIDNMCNTLYISHPIADLRYLKDILIYIWQAVNLEGTDEYTEKNVKEIKRYIIDLIENNVLSFPKHLNDFVDRRMKAWINNAYMAKTQMEEGHQYSILRRGKNIGEAVINDLQTGVEQINTQWSEGLQQFIQLKHTNKLTEESLKAIFMSNYIYFKEYGGDIYGMTGTLGAGIERDLLKKSYCLDFFQLPRFKKELNIREEGLIVQNRVEWLQSIKQEVDSLVNQNRVLNVQETKQASSIKNDTSKRIQDLNKKIEILEKERKYLEERLEKIIGENKECDKGLIIKNQEDIKEVNEKINILKIQQKEEQLNLENIVDILGEGKRVQGGRAVLIICSNKKDVDDIIKELAARHEYLYEYKGKIDGLRKVEKGGRSNPQEINQVRPGDIIVATNVAGRGTDFKISDLLERNGGLHVIVGYVPDNIRVENQAFGRSGRKGERGSGRMIAYDSRGFSLDELIAERDLQEEERLLDIRVKMIPRVELERELFKRFSKLSEESNHYLENKDVVYKELQKKSLHNKWALWLDKMGKEINEIYQTVEKGREKIFEEYEQFAKEMKYKMMRSKNCLDGFIDEPGELIKLAKYNIGEGNFREAQQNCDNLIEEFGKKYSAFAYYYKAIAIFRPSNDNSLTEIFNKHNRVINYEEKKEGIELLKKAIELFQQEIQGIQMRSLVLCNISKEKRNVGIGSSVDHFSQSNANEITILQIHLNAAQKSLSQELNVLELGQSLLGTIVTEDEAKNIYEKIIEDQSLSDHIKSTRLSKKVKVYYHVNAEIEKVKKILGNEVFNIARIQKEDYKSKQNINQAFSLTKENKSQLDKAGIEYTREMYLFDRIESNYRFINFPHPFRYVKNRFLESIENETIMKISSRQEVLQFKNCLTKEKVWQLLEENNVLRNVTCLRLGDNYQSLKDNNTFWESQIFKGIGVEIRDMLISKLSLSNKPNITYLSLEDFNKLVESKISNISKTNTNIDKKECNPKVILELFLEQEFLDSVCEKFTFNEITLNLISQYQEEIIFREGTKDEAIDNFDFDNFLQLKKNKEKLTKFLKGKLNQKIEKKEIGNILKATLIEDELDTTFQILKNALFAQNITQTLLMKMKFQEGNSRDIQEIAKIEEIVQQLFYQRIFTKEDIDFQPIQELLLDLKSVKAIKGKQFRYPLSRYPQKVDSIKESIEKIAKEQVQKVIDLRIKEGKLFNEQELAKEFQKELNENSISSTTLMLICSEVQKQPNNRNLNKILDGKEMQYDQLVNKIEKFIKKISEKEFENLSKIIGETILNTIGPLKRIEQTMVDCKNIEDYFRGGTTPKEVQEYGLLQKDLVLSFKEYHSPWSWKIFAVATFGIIQITAGTLIMVYSSGILGPFAYHLGSGLISEGAGDIIYGIQNIGNISGRTYWDHKKLSVLITIASVGIGAYLSRGAQVAKLGAQQFQGVVLRQGQTVGAKSIGGSVFKKIIGEVGKSTVKALQSMAIDKIGNLTTTLIFQEFKDFIQKLIQSNPLYVNQITLLKESLQELQEEIAEYHENESINSILEGFISESEQELNESLSNKITSLIGQIGGSLAEQIGLAQENIQFSGLKMTDGQLLGNNQSTIISNILNCIHKLMQFVKYGNAVYEIVTVSTEILKLINAKVNTKRQILQKSREQNAKQEVSESQKIIEQVKNKYTQSNTQTKPIKVQQNMMVYPDQQINVQHKLGQTQELNQCVQIINDRTFANVRNKVECGLVNPSFNKMIDYALKPITQKLEKQFFEDFNHLKKRALAQGEYESRYKNNQQEKGLELELVKELIQKDLNSLNVISPILETDLDNLESGKLIVFVDGKKIELNLDSEQDRNIIRDKFGSKGIWIIPGNPPSLSRPNYLNYLKALNQGKQFNITDLELTSNFINRPIILEKSNGDQIIIGQENENTPIYMKHIQGDSENTGHYKPIIRDEDGKYIEVEGLTNRGNACGIESILYVQKFEELKSQGMSVEEADKIARNHLTDQDIRQNFIDSLCKHSQKSSQLKNLFLERSHEIGVVGGVQQKFISSESSNNFFEAHYQKSIAIKNVIDISKQFEKEKQLIEKGESKKTLEELKQQAEKYWEQNKDKINPRIAGKTGYGGYHELLPNNTLKILYDRSCGLVEGVSPTMEFQGKQYNWLDLQYCLRVSTSSVVFKHTNENNLEDSAGHSGAVKFKNSTQSQKIYHDGFRDIINDSKTITEALSRVIVYHLSNTKSAADNPGNDVIYGFNNHKNHNIDDFNLSVACSRNDIKRIALQSELFYLNQNGLIKSADGSNVLSPIQPGTPRSTNDQKKIKSSSTYINEYTYKTATPQK